jgi:hypothetical protein
MFDTKLSIEDQAKIARVSGSCLAGLCRGTATALKGTGFVLDKSTAVTGSALHAIANGIETAGAISSGACYAGATALENKAEGYDLSDISDEQLKAALAAEQTEIAVEGQPA